jgi:serine/threonine protein kinase/tetratricopeptide (TPR) repeat protein
MSSAPASADEADSLLQRLVADMNRRWQDGERARAEDYLGRWPELHEQPGAALELIYEEVCLRREHGEEVAEAEVFRRFPQWQAELAVLLDCHRVLGPTLAAPRFPAAGEALGDFRLVAELGRGSAGRVFLATQPALADRSVVLKLVPLTGREHLTLARLQHTHIVPLYAVESDLSRNLRLLCMPYFGGLTLAQVLQALEDRTPVQRSGADVLAALRKARDSAPVALSDAGPAGEELAGPSYTRAVCWVGACLADALHYAHRRGLVHLDLKPSNVLLAADGQPMLLDFHLARGPLRAGGAPPDWMGGTPAYMAPEQEAALAAVREGRPVPQAVDGRADIYGLGLLLYEALGGTLPVPARHPAQALRRRNPRVPAGLADIVARCLAVDPGDRYPHAAALAEDLRRHLANLPLLGVANRLEDRWVKWRRRAPNALVMFLLVLAVLLVGGAGVAYLWQAAGMARTALGEGREKLRQREYREAGAALRHGLALAEDVPFQGALVQELRGELRTAERVLSAQQLHGTVEKIRPLYDTDELPPAQVRGVEANCRAHWLRRELVAERLVPGLPEELRQQVLADMLDLAILWADLHVRFAVPGQRPAALRDALALLDEAEALFGPSCVLDRERHDYAAALGRAPPAASAGLPRTAWEHYAMGRTLLRAGDLAGAEQHLEQALDASAPAPWPYHYYHGRCAFQLGRYEDAAADFSVCAALAPNCAWCFYNRALTYARRGDLDRALRDYDRALKLEPALAPAALNRGVLYYERKHYDKALADLERALEHGASPAAVAYNRALVYRARGDRAAAVRELRQALGHDPEHKDARALLDSLGER